MPLTDSEREAYRGRVVFEWDLCEPEERAMLRLEEPSLYRRVWAFCVEQGLAAFAREVSYEMWGDGEEPGR